MTSSVACDFIVTSFSVSTSAGTAPRGSAGARCASDVGVAGRRCPRASVGDPDAALRETHAPGGRVPDGARLAHDGLHHLARAGEGAGEADRLARPPRGGPRGPPRERRPGGVAGG